MWLVWSRSDCFRVVSTLSITFTSTVAPHICWSRISRCFRISWNGCCYALLSSSSTCVASFTPWLYSEYSSSCWIGPAGFVSPTLLIPYHFLPFPVLSNCYEVGSIFAVRFLSLKPFGIVCSVSSVYGDEFNFLTLSSIFDQKVINIIYITSIRVVLFDWIRSLMSKRQFYIPTS